MDINSFQRKAIIFIFISILVGAILLARKEPLKVERKEPKKKRLASAQAIPAKININTAYLPQLAKLPGIGPSLAKAIIRYRDKHGPFTTVDDLLKVPGIGPNRLDRMKGMISLKEKDIDGKDGKINLNTASPQELATITGIGPKISMAIVDYRIRNGPFHSIEELTNVPRIGQKTCEKLRQYLYVEFPSTSLPKGNASTGKMINTKKRSHEINSSQKCPHCGKTLWEKGKKKRVHIRCPHCMRILNE